MSKNRVIFRVYVDGELIGEGTNDVVMDLTGINKTQLCRMATNGGIYKGKYSFERVDDTGDMPTSSWAIKFVKEWNEARLKIIGKI